MITVVISGGFDPIHVGHLRMIEEAKNIGDRLIVILNNDDFLNDKKGFAFMPQDERAEIIKGFKYVDEVVISIDQDSTVVKTIEMIQKKQKIDIFANGGDRKNEDDIPESEICKKHNIKMIFNVGGEKIQSSSDLVKKEVLKPWGNYRTYEKNPNYLVKRITVEPNQKLSLQSHEHRSEFWIITKGTAVINLEEEEYELSEGEHIFIPLNSKHRLSNNSSKYLEVIEIQFGDILSEDDITRYEDNYGRIT
tara:strand:+ start:231 stop:980 length:750 start_codon:yes stop_codon:yes gene_type:complete